MTELTTTPAEARAPEGEGPPPWISPYMQQNIRWRDGDVVISVPAKSGTTWTMNIVHQLRTGGDADFEDVYAEVPWLEFVPAPGTDLDELVAGFDAMAHDRRRAFKTHSAPPDLPYLPEGQGPDVRYVVVARNPEEAVASFRPFLMAHSDAWFDLWDAPKDMIVGPDLPTFVEGIGQMMLAWTFSFLASWWPLRHAGNVHLVHYADLNRDPEPQIRALADFLGFEVADEDWPTILEHASFGWMKAHESKFELATTAPVPVLDRGAMIRKGQVGKAADDGVTPEIAAAVRAMGEQIVGDEQALAWMYGGGPVPA